MNTSINRLVTIPPISFFNMRDAGTFQLRKAIPFLSSRTSQSLLASLHECNLLRYEKSPYTALDWHMMPSCQNHPSFRRVWEGRNLNIWIRIDAVKFFLDWPKAIALVIECSIVSNVRRVFPTPKYWIRLMRCCSFLFLTQEICWMGTNVSD